MKLTYSRYSENFILEALDLELDEAGYLMYEDGGYVSTVCGKDSISIDNVGAYAHAEDAPNDTKVVCDHISCIVDWQKEKGRLK